MAIEIVTGDITAQDVDAIVNSANPCMLAGGGVCGAIHKAAGNELEQECIVIGHVDAGNAVVTGGYKLKAKHIIHAVASQWFGGHYQDEDEILEKCYYSIFSIVDMENIKSVAIPAIGIGSYRWPLDLAIPIAVRIAKEFDASHSDVLIRFVCFTEDIATTFKTFLQSDKIGHITP